MFGSGGRGDVGAEGVGEGVAPGVGGVGEGDGEGACGHEPVAAGGAQALRGHVGGAGPLDERVGARRGRRRRRRATPTPRTTRARARARWPATRRSRTPRRRPSRPARPRARRRTRRARRATSRATTSSRTRSCSAARDVEVGRRRGAAAEVVQVGPLGPAELGFGVTEQHDGVAVVQLRSRAAPTVSSSIRPTTPTTGVGSMSRPRDSL